MHSEAEYTLCNLDSHHSYQNTYSSSPDIYGFHAINGRSLDTGQACAGYYTGESSLSPQLGSPGELPAAGTQQLGAYGSNGALRLANRSTLHAYPAHIPTAHHHHHHQHQQQQATTQHTASVAAGHTFSGHHELATDCFTQHTQPTPNFLDITSRSGYQATIDKYGTGEPVKYGAGSPGPAHLTGSPMTNGYLPVPPAPLKSEGCSSQPALQGKPFRWMTIKRNPTKPGKTKSLGPNL